MTGKRVTGHLLIIPSCCFLLASLLGIIGCSDKDVAGPCYHEFLTPVVVIDSAVISYSSVVVSSFRIERIHINGVERDLNEFLLQPSYGIVAEDGALLCSPPCGFGTEKGTYLIRVSGYGLRAYIYELEAQYLNNWGNCPSFSSGATVVSLIFDEATK